MRAVVDPNVFVSSRISDLGHPAQIIRAADAARFELIVSERLLDELENVLLRERFRRYAAVEEVEELLVGLREKGTFFDEGDLGAFILNDPKDDYLVALALASGADYIVSGDPHLTDASLDEETIPVVVLTPRQFSALLQA